MEKSQLGQGQVGIPADSANSHPAPQAQIFHRLARNCWLLLLFILATYLSLKSLGAASFWCDEAHVGIMARNFLSEGRMTGWNGRNLYGFAGGRALDENLRPINAPLDIWVCAASFRFLGQSTWSGRLPFALAGLGALGLFATLIRLEARGNRLLQFYAVACLALSTPYLLYLRQCRYYSLAILGTVMALYAYRRLLAEPRSRWVLLLAGGAVVHFYANPMTCAAFLLALVSTDLLLRRRGRSSGTWVRLVAAAGLFLLSTLPYALLYRMWHRPDHADQVDGWVRTSAKLVWRNFRESTWTTPLTYVLLPAVVWCLLKPVGHHFRASYVREWALLAALYLLFLAGLSPQSAEGDWAADVRYQSPILPLTAALAGAGLWKVAQASRAVAGTLFGFSLTCVPWAFHPGYERFLWLLPGLVAEVHAPYPTATEAVSQYLKTYAGQDETVFASPAWMNYPLEFYVGHRIVLTGQLEDSSPFPDQINRKFPPHFWRKHAKPDWIVLYGMASWENARQYLEKEESIGGRQVRHYSHAARLPIYCQETQRPELTDHTYGPVRLFRQVEDSVHIFRRTSDLTTP